MEGQDVLASFSREKLLRAKKTVSRYLKETPCRPSHYLSELVGGEVYLKLENFQPTGSYKIRGAIHCLSQLTEQEKKLGIVASSAGNHAQGVAWASRMFGAQATIVMPERTPWAKVEGTEKLGARVILHGRGLAEAHAKMEELRDQEGLFVVHPFDDYQVIMGQSTLGQEVLDQVPRLDQVAVPIGGGGLAAGVGLAAHFFRPQVVLLGGQAQACPAMKESLQAQKIVKVSPGPTMAEGIAVAELRERSFQLVRKFYRADHVQTVDEPTMARSLVKVLEKEKILCEGPAALAYSLVLRDPERFRGKTSVVIISGGNVDLNFLTKLLERHLKQEGILASLRVVAPDSPGAMAHIAALIAQAGANILEVSQNRLLGQFALGEAQIDVVIECKGPSHRQEIISMLEKFFVVK